MNVTVEGGVKTQMVMDADGVHVPCRVVTLYIPIGATGSAVASVGGAELVIGAAPTKAGAKTATAAAVK